MRAGRLIIWISALVAGVAVLYVALLLIGFHTARDARYFEAHPDEHRRVLEECRAGRGWFAECEAAEAIAPDR